jgi:hypothetical protein
LASFSLWRHSAVNNSYSRSHLRLEIVVLKGVIPRFTFQVHIASLNNFRPVQDLAPIQSRNCAETLGAFPPLLGERAGVRESVRKGSVLHHSLILAVKTLAVSKAPEGWRTPRRSAFA